MIEIRPFQAIRYHERRLGGDLSAVLAPPYDVLDQADKDALLAGDERNIVAVDLPHVPPKTAGPSETYERAAKLLDQWLAEGILIRESAPALYAYHQSFQYQGQSYTRRMFIARVRLQPFSKRSILPHEKTFGGPKEDRLALMKATRCQLSPIFGLYSDPSSGILSALASSTEKAPAAIGKVGGVENRLWIMNDRDTIHRVTSLMGEKRIYIADGHHRYGTALMYRDWVASSLSQDGRKSSLHEDHPANDVMFVLAAMEDPGCLILPYYRTIAGMDLNTVLKAWAEGARVLSQGIAPDLVLHEGRTGRRTAVKFTRREVLAELAPNECPAWRELDYAYLHRYLIDELLAERAPTIRYSKSLQDALETAKAESGVALLVNSTPMVHLRKVAESGGLMPQKSTYFYPKLATGLVMNPLA